MMRHAFLSTLPLLLFLSGCLSPGETFDGSPPTGPVSDGAYATAGVLEGDSLSFTVEVGSGARAEVRFEFRGDHHDDITPFTLLPGNVSGAVLVSMLHHGQGILADGRFRYGMEMGLVRVGASGVGSITLGPPEPPETDPARIIAPQKSWTYELEEGHTHFDLSAVHARVDYFLNVSLLEGQGLSVQRDAYPTPVAQLFLYPNALGWNVTVEGGVAGRGAAHLTQSITVREPHNQFALFAAGPGSRVQMTGPGGWSCSSLPFYSTVTAVMGHALAPGRYDLEALLSPAAVMDSVAFWLLQQFPDHEADRAPMCA